MKIFFVNNNFIHALATFFCLTSIDAFGICENLFKILMTPKMICTDTNTCKVDWRPHLEKNIIVEFNNSVNTGIRVKQAVVKTKNYLSEITGADPSTVSRELTRTLNELKEESTRLNDVVYKMISFYSPDNQSLVAVKSRSLFTDADLGDAVGIFGRHLDSIIDELRARPIANIILVSGGTKNHPVDDAEADLAGSLYDYVRGRFPVKGSATVSMYDAGVHKSNLLIIVRDAGEAAGISFIYDPADPN